MLEDTAQRVVLKSMRVTLYSGPDCSLCEDAKEVIYPYLNRQSNANQQVVEMSVIDITTSLALKKQYGLRIPVLGRDLDNEELEWPFTSELLVRFLSGH